MTSHTDHLVADKISEEMGTRGVSVKQLADATGISRMTLTRRLTGHSSFTIAELAAIAAHFETTTDQLVAAARAGAA